jgi:gamma-glutamyltranspeptidase / glutathione hydrolase
MKYLAMIILLVLPLFASAAEPVQGKNGMVVAVSPLAAEVGLSILKQGGNAVDAAVAVAFAEAVTWPEAGNIGGGGFMLVWPGKGTPPVVIDYRETAPAAATVDMLAKGFSYQSHLVAGVPGTVRGLGLAHQKFGKLPWKQLVDPARKLASEGFTVNAALARSLNGVLNSKLTTNAEFRRVYGKGAKEQWKAGDQIILKDLGETLRLIADNDPDAFYQGELAAKLENEMKLGGGLITATDLAKYQAKERTPIKGNYRGYDIYGAPPPSSGGIVVNETLKILEQFNLAQHPRHSPETIHLIAEAQRRAFADRARYLGDQDFVKIPDHLITEAHAKRLSLTIDMGRATPSEQVARDLPLTETGGETTHFSVADRDGMCVSNTYTLENAFGNRVVVRGAGYILNNEMTDFNHRPGVTDRTGRIGTLPNQIAPGKRMLSSMSPTIVVKDGQPILITGSPGGRTIINTVLCVVINTIDYKMNVQDAVNAPRQHHQWFPDRLSLEDSPNFAELAGALNKLGHTTGKARQGDGHSIALDPKTRILFGGADKRLDGHAAGY